ncbi:hypothetical protein [Streptomyces sp. 8N706]|uniref:hypothetical protein n=1 Tax=Streptomyces sp. 8N706 TaxID=3457416 RepID=UPI003FCF490C
MGLLQGAILYVGNDGDTGSLRAWQTKMLWVIGINLVIAVSYTLWPKEAPAGAAPQDTERPRERLQSRR